MILQDIEQLLTARRLEIYKKDLSDVLQKPFTDKEKFDSLLLEYDKYKANADRCLKILSENDLSGLDDFATKRIIDAFSFATTLHLEADILLLREALKYAYTEDLSNAVAYEIAMEEKRLESLRETFNEALQDFRQQYTELLGNEQVILDSTLKSEFREFLSQT